MKRTNNFKKNSKVAPAAKPTKASSADIFPIVGIGASAGGLEAITHLLQNIPVDTGLSFVVIQHMDPSHESTLPEILGRVTQMPVIQGKDGLLLKPNHVYVSPPGSVVSLDNRTIKLSRRKGSPGPHMPIDSFFRSLSRNHGNRAIAVILSGTGSDGTLGLREIKENGGITFAQDEKSARFAGMPHSAALTGSVDSVLPAKEIAKEIVRISRHPYVSFVPPAHKEAELAVPLSAREESLTQILRLLRGAMKIDFTHYKSTTILRRITRRMTLRKMDRLEDYAGYLKKNPNEVKALYYDLLIKVTSFFRDPETFDALKTLVIPKILEKHPQEKPLRIWVPGCATGEEAYSIAICFLECLEKLTADIPIRIFATDVDDTALQKGRAGYYIENIAQDVSPDRLRTFFTKADNNYRINQSVREMCTFARHDVCSDPPFSNLDLISCRNLLIYLEPTLQKQVIPALHYGLVPGGFLTLGETETIGSFSNLFSVADKKNKIYVKRPGTGRLESVLFRSPSIKEKETARPMQARDVASNKAVDVYKEADRILLNRYAPSGVLVNDQMDILQFRGDTGRYLVPSEGKASFNLLKMAREGLMVDLRETIAQADKKNVTVRRENVQFRYEGQLLNVNLKVIPVSPLPSVGRHFLVVFEESFGPARRKSKKEADPASRENARLKQELEGTKQYLQSIIESQDATNEQLKSANEEVLSSNEELQSTNEELETAKEELQSANEELTTINDELHNRNLDLTSANNDLNNIFDSASLPILLLDKDLTVRRVTRVAQELLHIVPSDIGRPLGRLDLSVSTPVLKALILAAIKSAGSKETELQSHSGRWYSVRIHPYKTSEERVEGVILFFVDIDSVKGAEKLSQKLDELQIARDYSEGIVQTLRQPFVILGADLRVIRANSAFYRTFQITKAETDDRTLLSLGNGQWNIPELISRLEHVLSEGGSFDDFEVKQEFPNIGGRTMLLNARRVESAPGGVQTIFLAMEDITERRVADDKIKSALREKEVLLKEIHHRVKNNLQIISSLLKLQSGGDANPNVVGLLKESQNRIRAIALVHEKLYGSRDLSRVDMAEYIDALTLSLARSYEGWRKVRIRVRARHVSLDSERAVLCGLILNELISNVMKYAFPKGREGAVSIEMRSEPDQRAVLIVKDNGVGLPKSLDTSKISSHGLRLVQQLTEQMDGNVEFETSSGGTAITIRFPSEDPTGGNGDA